MRDYEPDKLHNPVKNLKPTPPFYRLRRFSNLRASASANDSLSQTNDYGPRCRVHFETPWLCC